MDKYLGSLISQVFSRDSLVFVSVYASESVMESGEQKSLCKTKSQQQ